MNRRCSESVSRVPVVLFSCSYVVTEGVKSKSTFDQSLNHYHISDVYPEIVDDIITRHNVIKVCMKLYMYTYLQPGKQC